jgi:hypothetical protein
MLAPGASVSVWSSGTTRYVISFLSPSLAQFLLIIFYFSDTGTAEELPSTVVMTKQRWFVGSEITTKLMNENGEVLIKHSISLPEESFIFDCPFLFL